MTEPEPLYKAIARVRGLCREHGCCEADLERLVNAYREAVDEIDRLRADDDPTAANYRDGSMVERIIAAQIDGQQSIDDYLEST